ncbi:MAG: hypothetical protein Q8K59_11970 [Nitrosomonas sp.]|nr:hypothetical protein [Nitrosomonas sp.]MDP1951781.1 hypothetical protein [Nitrosomonas sp.]
MSLKKALQTRSESKCELCAATESLAVYAVPPSSNGSADEHLLICATCCEQIENQEKIAANHWRCLNDSMWSPVPAVQVMAWRMLKRLSNEGWSRDLLDMLYLDEKTQAWAEATSEEKSRAGDVKHIDSNGSVY